MRSQNDQRVIFALTGGLGNQLFQLAAGLSYAESEELFLDWKIGKPRLNKLGKAEITSFELPEKVKFLPDKRWSKLVAKSSGYVLRMGIAPRGYENLKLVRLGIRITANLITTFYFRSKRMALAPVGVGYSNFSTPPSKNVLISGYFQSYKWASKDYIKSALVKLRIASPGEDLLKYQALAKSEKPLIVHIRLGDYKLESDFGILNKNYYLEAIRSISPNTYGRIWVFSDEPEGAKEFIPMDLREDVRWIPEMDGSAASTLELMRSGFAYVIGNSTFSWWGAFLSYQNDPPVFAPDPWFLNMESPIDLLPPTWKRIPGW